MNKVFAMQLAAPSLTIVLCFLFSDCFLDYVNCTVWHWFQLVESSKQKAEKSLIERREKVMLELEKLRQRVDEFNDYGELDMMQQYVQDVVKVQRRISDLQEQIEWINKVCAGYIHTAMFWCSQIL